MHGRPSVYIVFQKVSDDVSLLEEEAHCVGQGLGDRRHLLGLVAAAGEQATQPLAHQTRNIVTVQIVVRNLLRSLLVANSIDATSNATINRKSSKRCTCPRSLPIYEAIPSPIRFVISAIT